MSNLHGRVYKRIDDILVRLIEYWVVVLIEANLCVFSGHMVTIDR